VTIDDQPIAPVPRPANPGATTMRDSLHGSADPGADTADQLDEERRDTAGIVGSRFQRWMRVGILVALLVLLGVSRGLSILIVIAGVLVCIFLHELGHYLAARWSGMKATEFFVGFGPRIFSFRRGETEFGMKAIPAGAYVRIIGMSNLEEVDPADEPRAYRQKPFRSRLGVAVAGSAMHFLIAIVLLAVLMTFIGWPSGDSRWEIGSVTPGSAAAAAGLRERDQIERIGDRTVEDYATFRSELADSEPGPTTLTIVRDGTTREVTADLSQRLRVIGTISEDLDLLDTGGSVNVGSVKPGGEAELAGLAEDTTVESINGQPVSTLADVANAVDDSTGGVVVIRTTTDGTAEDHRVDLGTEVSTTPATTFLGVGSRAQLETQSVLTAVPSAFAEFGRTIGTTVVGVGQVLNPVNLAEFTSSLVSGPADTTSTPTPSENAPTGTLRPVSIIGAVIYGSDTAANPADLIYFFVVLNIFLGVFNLIPLLPFDGGHVAIAVYEKLQERRKRQRRYVADISRMLPVAYAVVLFLAVLFVITAYADVTRGVS